MSEVREGYKMTELGEIPINWKIGSLENLVNIRSGIAPSKLKLSHIKGIAPYFKVDDMNHATKYLVNAKNYLVETPNNLIHKNSVIFPKRGASIFTNKIAILKREGLIDTNLMVLHSNENQLNIEFLYYVLYNLKLYKIADTSSIPQINNKHINILKIKLPPLSEQQKIADILSTVDTQIEQTEQMIEQTKELKHGLMQQLLTKGIRHTEFKKSEVGKIPSNWDAKKIGELCELKGRIGWRGYTKEDLRDSGPLVIGATQINIHNKLDFSKPTFLSEEKFKESPEIVVSFGDIIYVKTGNTIGKLALVDVKGIKATINPNTVLLKNISCNNIYMYYFLSQDVFKQKVISTITIGAQPSINQKTLNNLMVAIPPLEEQKKIAEILSSVDDQIDIYEKEKEKYEELKKGLMQQLLTGKIRVKVDE